MINLLKKSSFARDAFPQLYAHIPCDIPAMSDL